MEDNSLQNEEIDFSIIGPNKAKNNQIDFSVESLLDLSEQPRPQQSPEQKSTSNQEIYRKQATNCDGSFMRDLGKLQKSVSYESVVYNIYESLQIPGENTRTIEGKQESTCTKTINNIHNITNLTKGNSNILQPDFKHLILDFRNQSEGSNQKIKQNFENYFGTLHIIKNKHPESQQSNSKSRSKTHRKVSTELSVIPKNQLYKFKNIHTEQSVHKKTKVNSLTQNAKIHNLGQKTKSNTKLYSESSKKVLLSDTHKTKINSFVSKELKNQRYRTSNCKSSRSKGPVEKKLSKNSKNESNTRKKVSKKSEIKQAVYSQYFGFSREGHHERSQKSHILKNQKLSKNKKDRSKSKKVVLSKKNIKISHAK